jgi:hypothetical protein
LERRTIRAIQILLRENQYLQRGGGFENNCIVEQYPDAYIVAFEKDRKIDLE